MGEGEPQDVRGSQIGVERRCTRAHTFTLCMECANHGRPCSRCGSERGNGLGDRVSRMPLRRVRERGARADRRRCGMCVRTLCSTYLKNVCVSFQIMKKNEGAEELGPRVDCMAPSFTSFHAMARTRVNEWMNESMVSAFATTCAKRISSQVGAHTEVPEAREARRHRAPGPTPAHRSTCAPVGHRRPGRNHCPCLW